jgi:hypothetical protein
MNRQGTLPPAKYEPFTPAATLSDPYGPIMLPIRELCGSRYAIGLNDKLDFADILEPSCFENLRGLACGSPDSYQIVYVR